ncbi:unnamed protein product, partial [Ectocarpus sp. 8 AP-2014]
MTWPGKNDFKRPTFALGRISFGVDDDSSSSSSNSFSAEDSAFGAARSKELSPISSGNRVPLAPAAGAENVGGGGSGGGGGIGAGPWKMSSGGGGGSSGRASVLADRSLRENARVDMDKDQERRCSPFSSPAVDSARHAGGSGGGHSKAAATRPRDCRRRSLNESWGSPVVAGESSREEISPLPLPAAVSGKTPRDRRGCADPARGSGLPPPPPPPEKDGAAVPSEAGAARRAGAAAPGEESPAIGTGSPGDAGAGSEDFPDAWDDGGGMYDDYGDDFGSGGVYTYSPSPPRSSAAASAGGMGAECSPFRSSFGGPVSSSNGNSSSNARDSAGGKSAASSPVDTSHVLDLSASSPPPPPPPTSRFSKEALPPKSPTVASGNRKGQASERFVVYLVVGAAGEWRREAGGEAWKMAASGGGGNASGGREGDDDESDDYELTPRKKKEAFSVPAELYNRMYAHQRIGVRWLWSLHQGDMGGILGDDMGLGKTFQVTCFLAGLFGTGQAKSALVLAPKSVMRGWEDELGRWLVRAACPKAEVVVMASEMPAKARRRAIALAAEGGSRGRGAVLITTYGMVSSNPKQFAPAVGGSGGWIEREEPRKHVWDYVILDEGHKIKNASTK